MMLRASASVVMPMRDKMRTFKLILEYISVKSLNDFIDLLVKIKGLISSRKTDEQRVFSEIVDPIFISVQPVVDDYVKLFATTQRKLSCVKEKSEYRDALIEFRVARLNLLPKRAEIRAIVEETMRVSTEKDIRQFLGSINSLFYEDDPSPDRFKMSRSLKTHGLLEMLSDGSEGVTKEYAEQCIALSIRQIEGRLTSTAQIYAVLRVRTQVRLARAQTF